MSIICPNLSNPDVAREFNELKEATSERAAYAIWSLNEGNMIDKAPNGEPSILFGTILGILKNRTYAIKEKAKYYSKSFFETFGHWIDDKSETAGHLDKNGEPKVINYNKEAIDRFLDKLIPAQRPLRHRSKHGRIKQIDTKREIEAFVYNLLGVSINLEDIDEKDIKENVEFFLRNQYKKELEKSLQNLQDKLNNIEYRYVDAYLLNMMAFLQRGDTSVLSEYDKKTQKIILKIFPKIFNHRKDVTTKLMFGYYKHALVEKKGPVYDEIYRQLNEPNIRRFSLQKKVDKLSTIKLTLDLYPRIIRRINNKVQNQIDRIFEEYLYLDRKNENPTYSLPSIDLLEKASTSGKKYFDFNSAIIETGKVYSAADILNYIKNDRKYEDLVNIILKSLETQGDIKIAGIADTSATYGGLYSFDEDGGENAVYINTASKLYLTDPIHTILHELIHGITSLSLHNNPALEKQFEEYIQYLIDVGIGNDFFGMRRFYTPYGFRAQGKISSHEFIAEFMTNYDFLDLLKHIPAMEDSRFKSIFDSIVDFILRLLNIHKTAYDQIRPIVLYVIGMQDETVNDISSSPNILAHGFDENGNLVGEVSEFATELEKDSTRRIGSQYDAYDDYKTISELNNYGLSIDAWIINQIIKAKKNDPNADVLLVAQDAKREWIENRQKLILNDTQIRLAEAYGLRQEVREDGRIRFVSDSDDEKSRLVVDFLDYISGDTEGYYDYNSKSTAAHHVIAISLTNGDPSTFSHELAHHYIRMFWRSELILTSLRAVNKAGMTDEEREEALVDIITARTNDIDFFSSIESESFILKFWGALAHLLYTTFGIENEAIRNALYRNITKSFALNEKQRIVNSQNYVFEMANSRMFKRAKTYKQKVKQARELAHRNKSDVGYEQIGSDKTQSAIKSIIQGSISRNKNFRKNDIQNPKILVDMQIAEDRVRKFAEDINEYRQRFISSLGSISRPTNKQRKDSAYTPEEIAANLELIRGFISQAKDELDDVAERFVSMESSRWAYYVTKEVVDPASGDVATEYLDASHVNDADVNVTQIDFKELSDINQNILGFYDKTLKNLYDAVRSPQFKNMYGQLVQDEILSELTSVNTVSTGGVRMLDAITHLRACYDDAITTRLHQFVEQYIKNNTPGLDDNKKEKLIYSVNTWLENQNAFGDIGAVETWLGLASNSKSSLIRLMQDLIDNSSLEQNDAVNEKGFYLRLLRINAMRALNKFKTDDFKFYGFISPFNIDKLLMESDEDGFTGNFISNVNEGKFYNDRSKFIDELLYKKGGILDQLRVKLGDTEFELEIDARGEPMFPEGQDDTEKSYLHEVNRWMGKHCVRRFTTEYYAKRIDMLSPVTRRALTQIQNQINTIINACTIDGKVHTELLTRTKIRDLQLLYYRKNQLANPFDQFGRKKEDDSEEALIARELTAWNKWQSEHIKNKLDYDAFEEAKKNAKDKDQFERDNTYTVINPKIWEEIARLFPNSSSQKLADLRYTRNKLVSIIKTKKGLYYPRFDEVINMETGEIRAGYEEFWENLKHYDEIIESLKNSEKTGKLTNYALYKSLMTSLPVMVTLSGGTLETMYAHIQKKIKKRLEAQYGKNDRRVVTQLASEMEKFQYTIRSAGGQMSKKGPLSIFSITQPPAKEINTSEGLIPATIQEPILAYSVIDALNSDPSFVDLRFDASLNKPVLPITDDTKRSSDEVSYTNEKYTKYIENGPQELIDYYNALKETMELSYKDIPFAGVYDGRLPQQGASTGQMFHRNKWWNIGKPIQYWFRRRFTINEQDTDINIDYELRPDGTRSMNIPVRYLKRLDNPNEINSDILGSVISFYEMSQNYKRKSKMLPLFLTAIDKLENSNNNRDRQKTFLKGVVNRSFYERQRNFDINEDNLMSYTDRWIKVALKVIPGLRMLTTTGLLALNWLAGIISYLDPAVQIVMDSLSGRYMGLDDYVLGTLKMLSRLPAAIVSAGKSKSYDIVSSGMRKFGLAKTGSINFRNMDRSQLRRFLQDGILMFPFSIGEHTVNALVFCIIMNSYRYINEAKTFMNKKEYYEYALANGIPIKQAKYKFFVAPTLLNAYKIDELGNFVTKNNKYGNAVTEELESRVGKRMRNRATVSNLIVPGNERTKIQSNVLTAFTVVMRTFMLVGIGERFRSLRDFLIDDDSPIDENTASNARRMLKLDYYSDKGGYNFLTGEIEDGIVSAFFHLCGIGELFTYVFQSIKQFKIRPSETDTPKHFINAVKYGAYSIIHPFRSRYNEKSKLKQQDLEISESDIYAFDRIVSEIAAIGLLALMQTVFHNKMVDDGDDDEYWNQVVDHILIRLTIVRYTWFDINTFMDLINSITPSKSDIDKKLKFVDLLKDAYTGFKEHGRHYEDWEKVTSGGYKNAPKAFRDLLLTFSSLGLHNLYTSKSTEGVKTKTKWFKKMVWWDGYWHDAKPGKKSQSTSNIPYPNDLDGLSGLDNLNSIDNLNNLGGLGGF